MSVRKICTFNVDEIDTCNYQLFKVPLYVTQQYIKLPVIIITLFFGTKVILLTDVCKKLSQTRLWQAALGRN